MASPTFSDVVLRREVRRLRQQKTVFMNFVSREYEGELQGKNSVVFVPVMTNITLTGSSITGTANNTLGTWPGQAITNSSSTFSLESLSLSKYAPYRETLTEFQLKHAKVPLEMAIADNLTTAEGVLMDNFVRDLILVDKVASIPAGNKINSGAPIAITTGSIVAEISKMVTQLDVQNAPEDKRVLFVSPATASLFFQSALLAGTNNGLDQVQKGFLGMYRGVKVVQSNALTASNEMIMFVEGSCNVVADYYALENRDATDGKYTNLLYELVYGGQIFSPNLVNVVINYCI